MKSDRANVCTLASALINSQPLSALPRLHFKIPNRVSALPRLHLKIANQSGCLHLRVWKNPDYQTTSTKETQAQNPALQFILGKSLVRENIIGEKFAILWKNIHPCPVY